MPAQFLPRPYPHANAILLPGPAPVLIDPGFGSGVGPLLDLLRQHGAPPERLGLVANTHFHCDHAGANHALQHRMGIPVAAGAQEAALVDARDPEACRAGFLSQPVEPYHVDRHLAEGDTIAAGAEPWRVVAAPGHTAGGIAFWEPRERTLVSGDALHDADLGWIGTFQEGADALDRAADTLDRFAALRPALVLPGHGPAITNPDAAIARARGRIALWRTDPAAMAWHACRRILAYALMVEDGMDAARLHAYLMQAPWVAAFAREPFGMDAAGFAPLLLANATRGAASWQDGVLLPTSAYERPGPGWLTAAGRPQDWPPRP